MRNRLLLLIDPQVDFITGSLPVPGAEESMNALAEYLGIHSEEYLNIIVTADRHPMRHCSFRSEGGTWPEHCVADSVGAAIWPPIMSELINQSDKVEVLHKGEDALREEYSIFKNCASKERIRQILETGHIGEIDICGLAGDVCVADSIRDGINLGLSRKINALSRFSPSVDGGETLDSIIFQYGLSCVR